MNKYNSYKPSGIYWIKDIPSNWIVTKYKYLYSSGMGFTILKEDLVEGGSIPVYSATEDDSVFGYVNSCSLILEKGDIIIPARGNSIGHIMLVQHKCTSTQTTIYSKKIFTRIDDKYCYYFLKGGKEYLFQFDRTAIPQITVGQVNENTILLPPITEQIQIVRFLDRKTEIIDKLISTKERKIELLKEQRTSLINQVITKGLDPNVKMKDSGIEWIGGIPEHWEVKSLKYVVRCNDKVLPESTDPNYELNYVEISDVDSSGNVNTITPYVFKDCPSRCRRILSKGDVFVSTVRTYLKSIGYIKDDVENLICSTGFCVLTPDKKILSKYLYYQVLTEFFIGEVISKSEGVSYPSITSTELVNIKILLPSISEQEQIIEYLDGQIKLIDESVMLEKNKIELLKDYRQSLISEVITGKIDVRNNVN